MSLHVTLDMTEIDSGDYRSNGREDSIFIDKKFKLIPIAILELHFTISTVKVANTLN